MKGCVARGAGRSPHLLREQPCAIHLFSAFKKFSLAVIEDAKVAEKFQQLVVAEEISGISGVAEHPLVDEVSLKDDMPAELEGLFHLGDKGPLKEIKIQDQVISGVGKFNAVQVRLPEVYRQPFLLRRFARLLHSDRRDVNGFYAKASLG